MAIIKYAKVNNCSQFCVYDLSFISNIFLYDYYGSVNYYIIFSCDFIEGINIFLNYYAQ